MTESRIPKERAAGLALIVGALLDVGMCGPVVANTEPPAYLNLNPIFRSCGTNDYGWLMHHLGMIAPERPPAIPPMTEYDHPAHSRTAFENLTRCPSQKPDPVDALNQRDVLTSAVTARK